MPRSMIRCESCNIRIRDNSKKRKLDQTVVCLSCYVNLNKNLSASTEKRKENETNESVMNLHSVDNQEKASTSNEVFDDGNEDSAKNNINAGASTSNEAFEPEIKKMKLSFKRCAKSRNR